MEKNRVSSIELLLCLFEKGQPIQGRDAVDSVVSISKEIGLPFKYRFQYSPPQGPVSLELHNDINFMILSEMISFSPSIQEALEKSKELTFHVTEKGKKESERIKEDIGKEFLELLDKASGLFREDKKVISTLSTFLHCRKNNFKRLELGQIAKIYSLDGNQTENVERLYDTLLK